MEAGQIGYEAYAASTGGKTYDGRAMPTWKQVKERTPHVAKAWNDAALAIAMAPAVDPSIPSRLRALYLALHSDGRRSGLDFGEALAHLKAGRRVARAGWNGKGMWIALTPGSVIEATQARVGAAQHVADSRRAVSGEPDGQIRICPHLDMRAADGSLVIGWLASQTDLLAEDWMVVE